MSENDDHEQDGARLHAVAAEILKGLLVVTDAQLAFARLEDFRLFLMRNSNHSWLSVVRNAVQST